MYEIIRVARSPIALTYPLFVYGIIWVARSPIAFSTSANATDVFVGLCLLEGASLSVFKLEFLVVVTVRVLEPEPCVDCMPHCASTLLVPGLRAAAAESHLGVFDLCLDNPQKLLRFILATANLIGALR